MRLIEGYPKLVTLMFQDEAHFQPTIRNMKHSDNQLLAMSTRSTAERVTYASAP